MYQSVSVCISLYQPVSVCIGLYQSVSACIGLHQSVSACIGLYQSVNLWVQEEEYAYGLAIFLLFEIMKYVYFKQDFTFFWPLSI
jgi:hypothetical protein